MQRESMDYDVVIVGGGPAGLAAAIRIKQLDDAISVCLIEKGGEIGAHIVSGAVMDPRAIAELIPDWKQLGAPLNTLVAEDRLLILGERHSFKIPTWALPACFRNEGNYVVSLGNVCRWLGQQAEGLGVEIYPGFAGADVRFDEQGAVRGVITGDAGRLRDASPGPAFQLGMELNAKYTFFGEGCRGHLGKQLHKRFELGKDAAVQTYGLGIKELWEVPPESHRPGLVVHTAGWPMQLDTYGGGFLYHLDVNKIAVGFVVGLGYRNPYLSPFEEFQRFKTHKEIGKFLKGGRRLGYGARALTAGGLSSLPALAFPGGVLIGDDAGFLNASRIKGSHAAIKSGMLAAEACVAALKAGRRHDVLSQYTTDFQNSWLYEELYRARNFKPWMTKGLALGSVMFGVDQIVFRGKAPWTLHNKGADHMQLRPAADYDAIAYPKPDGVLTFDRLSSVFYSGTHHEEDQPCHLVLRDERIPLRVNLAHYDAPEERFCPAGVYEILRGERPGAERLQINAQNCLHCKTCDIKDPTQNIDWLPPRGGEGPIYQDM